MNWSKVIEHLEEHPTAAPLTCVRLARALRAGCPKAMEPTVAEWLEGVMEANDGVMPQYDVFALGRRYNYGPKLIMDAAAACGVRLVITKGRVDLTNKSLAVAAR